MTNNDERDRAYNVKKSLESLLIQGTLGHNLVMNNPHSYVGEIGHQSAEDFYEKLMSGEEAKKAKENIYQSKVQEGKSFGVPGEPSYPTNYDLALLITKQAEEVMSMARLGELEKAAKSIGAKLGFEVPEELKNYMKNEIVKKAYNSKTGKVDVKSLSEQEQDALNLYSVLNESYKRACVLNVSSNYFKDLSTQGKEIADKYNKQTEQKAT